MRAIAPILIALAVTSGTAVGDVKDPPPKKVEFNPKKADVTVLKDADGGIYVVVSAPPADSTARQVFYGKGKQLYLQFLASMSADGSKHTWMVSMWAPRVPGYKDATIGRHEDGTFVRICETEDAVLSEVTGAKATEILTKSQFLSPLFTRTDQVLGRDDTGVYYYVDRLRKDYGGEGYRLFIGKKGALKQVPLTDVTVDERGQIYATKTGTFSVSVGEAPSDLGDGFTQRVVTKMTWIKGERRIPLDILRGEQLMADQLIYNGLGVYTKLGTICDDD